MRTPETTSCFVRRPRNTVSTIAAASANGSSASQTSRWTMICRVGSLSGKLTLNGTNVATAIASAPTGAKTRPMTAR